MKDACYRKVKASVHVFPSARASQMIAKCRKHEGHVRKTEKGAAIRRWEKEKWVNTETNKPCGQGKNDHNAYCRPSKKISKQTPVLKGNKLDKSRQNQKHHGQRAKPRK